MIELADTAWTTVLSALVGLTGEVVSVDVIHADSLRLVALAVGLLERADALSDDDDELVVGVDASLFFVVPERVRSAELTEGVLTIDATDTIYVFRPVGIEEAV